MPLLHTESGGLRRLEMAGLQRIRLSLPIDRPEICSPTSSLNAKPRLRPAPCVPTSSSSPTLAYGDPHRRQERAGEGSASLASARLPPLAFTKSLANLPCQIAISEGEVLLLDPRPATPPAPTPKPPLPHLPLLPRPRCLEGREEGQRRQTAKQACVQMIRWM